MDLTVQVPSPRSQSENAVCWVCLEEASSSRPLIHPCSCPRTVHAQCLARWQLHSAGSQEENECRFCKSQLPDWRPVLGPSLDAKAPIYPTMSVTFNGRVHHVEVRDGEGAYEAFLNEIRRIFGITEDHDMQLAFDCADPVTGALVKLSGAGSFHAAVHCATVSAAKRLKTQQGKRRREGRPQLTALQMFDSASSLEMEIDEALPSRLNSPQPSPVMQQSSPLAYGSPSSAFSSKSNACQTAADMVSHIERTAALRSAHKKSIEEMMRRVLQMRSAQTSTDVVATSPSRLDQLEAHLRSMLEHHHTSQA